MDWKRIQQERMKELLMQRIKRVAIGRLLRVVSEVNCKLVFYVRVKERMEKNIVKIGIH